MSYQEKLKVYDEILLEAGFKRQGKTMPFTSARGHMFTLFNKAAEMGIRFDKKTQKEYFDKYNTEQYISYNSKMQGYILITDEMLKDRDLVIRLVKESYEYICTLDPK